MIINVRLVNRCLYTVVKFELLISEQVHVIVYSMYMNKSIQKCQENVFPNVSLHFLNVCFTIKRTLL